MRVTGKDYCLICKVIGCYGIPLFHRRWSGAGYSIKRHCKEELASQKFSDTTSKKHVSLNHRRKQRDGRLANRQRKACSSCQPRRTTEFYVARARDHGARRQEHPLSPRLVSGTLHARCNHTAQRQLLDLSSMPCCPRCAPRSRRTDESLRLYVGRPQRMRLEGRRGPSRSRGAPSDQGASRLRASSSNLSPFFLLLTSRREKKKREFIFSLPILGSYVYDLLAYHLIGLLSYFFFSHLFPPREHFCPSSPLYLRAVFQIALGI
jgi:hypothetical protein